jgi:hypothetical protein
LGLAGRSSVAGHRTLDFSLAAKDVASFECIIVADGEGFVKALGGVNVAVHHHGWVQAFYRAVGLDQFPTSRQIAILGPDGQQSTKPRLTAATARDVVRLFPDKGSIYWAS